MGSSGGSRSPRQPAPSRHEQAGTILAGKYRVERVLGRGGMGLVLACRHQSLRQTVALKLLLPSAGRPEVTSRLLREARAAAALKSDRVARVFDVDTLDDGTGYIVMEYLEGQTLAALLEEKGRLEPERAVDYALQACEALAEAHELGIVHRDLKPSNLFLAKRRAQPTSLCVLDFGISKAFDRASDEPTTDSHAFVGSPPYASPEQLTSPRNVDARTDIWSLGIVLFECLSGSVPFKGETLTSLWNSILRDELPPFSSDPTLDPELERTIRRCLEKSSDARYPNVLALARELVRHGSPRAQVSLEAIEANVAAASDHAGLPSNGSPAELTADTTLTEAPIVQEFGREKGSRRRLSALLVAGLVLAGMVTLSMLAGREPETPNTTAVGPARATTAAAPAPSAVAESPVYRPGAVSPSAAEPHVGSGDSQATSFAAPKARVVRKPSESARNAVLVPTPAPSAVRPVETERSSPVQRPPEAAAATVAHPPAEADVYADRE